MAYTGPFPHTNTGVTSAIVVSGPTSFSGTVGNSGTISGGWTSNPTPPPGATGIGIAVGDDATINGHIGNAGVISVSGGGIVVGGTSNAIDDSNVTGGIINGSSGSITAGEWGIAVVYETQFTGGIVNNAGGKITAGTAAGTPDSGIYVYDVGTFGGGVTNAGSITAPGGAGIDIESAGIFTGNIVNSGNIFSLDTGIYVDSAAISGYTGNIGNTGGKIVSTDEEGVYVTDVAYSGKFTGNIGNTGTVSSYKTGLSVVDVGGSGFTGTIGNGGKITSITATGIYVDSVAFDAGAVFSGNIQNNGSITALGTNGYGLYVSEVADSGSFHGNITNAGTISSYDTGLYIEYAGGSGFTGNIGNTGGTIVSTDSEGVEVEYVASAGKFTGNIGNTGTISSLATGLYVYDVGYTGFAGTIGNGGKIISTDDYGLFVETVATSTGAVFSGNIQNNGSITALGSTDGYGMYIEDVADSGTFLGNITNAGTISSYDDGMYLDDVGYSAFSGNIGNTGGKITSTDSDGIDVSGAAELGKFTGNIGNTGIISSYDDGIYLSAVGSGGFTGTIGNGGKIISTDGSGVYATEVASGAAAVFSGNIQNIGSITAADGYGLRAEYIADDGMFLGNITNAGAISSYDAGLYAYGVGDAGFTGNIGNTGGTIVSTDSYGIEVLFAADDGKFTGNIGNTGTISSHSTGMLVEYVGYSGFTGTIGNGGKITSTDDYGIYAESVATSAGAVFSGNIQNNGSITALGSTDGYGMYIYEVADSGGFVGNITDAGKITSYDTGMEVFDVGYSGFSGNIGNAGGTIVSTDGSGIYVHDVAIGGQYTGNVGNTGTISALSNGMAVQGVGYTGYAGIIGNGGSITATNDYGMYVSSVADGSGAVFSGNIQNVGKITALAGGGLHVSDVANTGGTFLGNITNSGTISSYDTGVFIYYDGDSAFSGNIGNTGGTIVSTNGIGLDLYDIAAAGQYTGNIGNTGTISALSNGMSVDTVGYTGYTGIIGNGGHITTTAGTGMYVFDVANSPGAVFSGTIQNNGSIATPGGSDGLVIEYVADDGTFIGNITNAGTISSHDTGLYVDDVGAAAFDGVIKNYGTISSETADGVYVNTVSGIDVSNVTSGVITGVIGVELDTNTTSVTLADASTIKSITGSGGTAIELNGTSDNLELFNGYNIVGSAIGDSVDSELELAGPGGHFNLSNLGPQYNDFNSFDVLSGGKWAFSGTGAAGTGTTSGLTVDSGGTAFLTGKYTSGTVDSGGTLIVKSGGDAVTWNIMAGGTKITEAGGTGGVDDTDSGTVIVGSGGSDIGTTVVNGGILIVNSGGVATGTNLQGGTVEISGGSDALAAGGSGSVDFTASGGSTLILDGAFAGTISGFGGPNHTNSAQSIDLASVTWGSGITDSFNNGMLAVSSGGTVVADIKFAGSYATANFHLFDDGGMVGITDPTASAVALFGNHIAGFAPSTGITAGAVISAPSIEAAALAAPSHHG